MRFLSKGVFLLTEWNQVGETRLVPAMQAADAYVKSEQPGAAASAHLNRALLLVVLGQVAEACQAYEEVRPDLNHVNS